VNGSAQHAVPERDNRGMRHEHGGVEWSPHSGALDLWVALMTGASVTVADAPVETVAA
jgi:hypothetical protein